MMLATGIRSRTSRRKKKFQSKIAPIPLLYNHGAMQFSVTIAAWTKCSNRVLRTDSTNLFRAGGPIIGLLFRAGGPKNRTGRI